MFEKKKQAEHKPRDDGVELENQFIMRFPKVGQRSLSFDTFDKLPPFVAPGQCGARVHTGR